MYESCAVRALRGNEASRGTMAETKVAAVQTQLNGIMDTIDVKILRPRMVRLPGWHPDAADQESSCSSACSLHTHTQTEGGCCLRRTHDQCNGDLAFSPEKPQGLPSSGTFSRCRLLRHE